MAAPEMRPSAEPLLTRLRRSGCRATFDEKGIRFMRAKAVVPPASVSSLAMARQITVVDFDQQRSSDNLMKRRSSTGIGSPDPHRHADLRQYRGEIARDAP